MSSFLSATPTRTLQGRRPPGGQLKAARVYNLECDRVSIVHGPTGVFRDPTRFAVRIAAGSCSSPDGKALSRLAGARSRR
jgi:hypothetical protein